MQFEDFWFVSGIGSQPPQPFAKIYSLLTFWGYMVDIFFRQDVKAVSCIDKEQHTASLYEVVRTGDAFGYDQLKQVLSAS